MTTEEQNFPWDLKNLPQAGIGNGPTALVAGIDPDPRETLRAIREQLQIEQVGTNTYTGYEVGTNIYRGQELGTNTNIGHEQALKDRFTVLC